MKKNETIEELIEQKREDMLKLDNTTVNIESIYSEITKLSKTKLKKERINREGIKRLPFLYAICRWIKNIILITRRLDVLFSSYQSLEQRLNLYRQEHGGTDIDKEFYDNLYLHYNESLMPDSREEVKGRAVGYIDKLKKYCEEMNWESAQLNFVDLGCGECEWIELLAENGFHSIGVDSNSVVVRKVKEEQPEIEIIEQGAIEYLQSCADDSFHCISSFHMVEHMNYLTIMTLLKECHRVLKSDGMLIIETPNPQNILTSTYYFYMDPTHQKPIPLELMKFFLEECGFDIYEKLLLNPLDFEPYDYREDSPIKDIVFRFNMEQAYSFMAVKK